MMRRLSPLLVVAALLVLRVSIGWAAEEPRLSVQYHTPQLAVDAHDMTLEQVLAHIGIAVGFEVLGDASSTTVDVTMRDASVEDVLRQLLRGENHILVYRGGAEDSAPALDRVVLLGRSPREATLAASTDPGTVGVADLLRTHAMAAAQPAVTPGPVLDAPPMSHVDPGAALAEATRRAHQGVAALVEGLATATRALQESAAAGSK